MPRPIDTLSPPNITQLSEFDNYEIYSIVAACLPSVPATAYERAFTQEVWIAGTQDSVTFSAAQSGIAALDPLVRASGNFPRGAAVFLASVVADSYRWTNFAFDRILQNYPARQSNSNTTANARKLYAVQSYSPKHRVDFAGLLSVMAAYPPKSGNGWIIYTTGSAEPIKWFSPVSEFDWSKLAVNGQVKFSGISPITGSLTYSYWGWNPFEQHPQINLCCDYRQHTIKLSQGKAFTLDLRYPIAQTLKIFNSSLSVILAEISATVTGNKPNGLVEYLIGSTAYAARIVPQYLAPPIEPVPNQPPDADRLAYITWSKILFPSGGTAGGWEYKLDGGSGTHNPPIVTRSRAIYTAVDLQYQIIPALNNHWGHGATLPPFEEFYGILPDLPPGVTYEQLFFTPQFDNSYGVLEMDSIRTLEIRELVGDLDARLQALENSLDASVYGYDPEQPTEKRGANLGWLIEKIAQVLGIRRQPSGKFLTEQEASKYQRTRANNPRWSQGDYAQSTWGKFGMAINYLPTTYADGQRQDNLVDIVHDIPQLALAILDQLDHSQGIQHSSSIRLPVGDQVQAYPNQGAAVQDTAARTIDLERSIEQLLVMGVETGNSLRELYAGIGIPVSTKSVSVKIGGKIKSIAYPGYQQSKPSIFETLGGLQKNIGIIIGALMPRGNPIASLNPWAKKK
jgi:hypothetical protein